MVFSLQDMGTSVEKRGAILVVEDDEFMRLALKRYCSSYGEVVAVSTVLDAMTAIRGDLIAAVLDVHLPDGSGLAVLEELREHKPDLPVLVLTGDATVEVAIRAKELGAEFLRKTDDSKRLKDFLNRATRTPSYQRPRSRTPDDSFLS